MAAGPVAPDDWQRIAGCCGIAGGALFFVGDMLMYGHFGAGANFGAGMRATVATAPLWRLYAGGLAGPVAAWLGAIGFWYLYRSMAPGGMRSAVLVMGSFAMVVLGSVHALWIARALAIRECGIAACSGLRAGLDDYWNFLYYCGAAPAYLAALLLAVAVWRRRTRFARWTILANPAILGLLSPLAIAIPAPLGAVVVGGDANLFIAIFFAVVVASTWRDGVQEPPAGRG